jgi:Rrf2 family protein
MRYLLKQPEKRKMLLVQLSSRADHALRAAAELAAARDRRVTAGRLAQAQDIPGALLETILVQLRRANIVRLQRGPDGGYWLARPAAEISLADIIRAADGQAPGGRPENGNEARPGPADPLRRVRAALDANEQAVLQAVTLADIGQDGGDLDWIRHRPRRPPAEG